MIIINIALVLLGIMIPLVTAIFWSKARKTLIIKFENKSCGPSVLDDNTVYNLVKWLYNHKTKFNIIVAAIVTIIEFLALLPF
jgi:hypothetical protein